MSLMFSPMMKQATDHTVHILIIDDDQDDYMILRDYIHEIEGVDYQITWCPRYVDALRHVIARDYDLYFVDYRLGAKSGVDLLKQAHAHECEEPFILLTGVGNYHVDIEAMQLGAVDYLVKPELSVEKLERSIRYALDRSASLKALRANERKYRSIFEKTKDIVFITRESLHFEDVNEAVLPILGYPVSEFLKMSLLDLIVHAQHRKFIQHALTRGMEVDDQEILLHTKDGVRKSCIITATPEVDSSGIPYVQGIIHDITSLKKVEKASLQTEKLAATGRLVRALAHEVRNPLNNITLSVEQLYEEVNSESAHLYMDIIERNSKRISNLISALLDTSAPSEITLRPEVFQAVIDQVITVAIDRLTLKHIKLHLHYPEAALYIRADREKLAIALLNIVINAIEAMEEYKGRLSVTLSCVQDQVILQIADNGCGIQEEFLSQLFEPYFTQKKNGIGLGLAVSMNTLQSHGAAVEVSSVLGLGTSFVLTFPLYSESGMSLAV